MSLAYKITRCVEDLSRKAGRPLLGRTRFAVTSELGNTIAFCDSQEEAERKISEQLDSDIAGDFWATRTAAQRQELRHEFNHSTAYDEFKSVCHYALAKHNRTI